MRTMRSLGEKLVDGSWSFLGVPRIAMGHGQMVLGQKKLPQKKPIGKSKNRPIHLWFCRAFRFERQIICFIG